MKLDFLTPQDPRWLEFVRGAPHQFYHLPGYVELWARRDQGVAEAVLITEGTDYFFLPYSILALEGVLEVACPQLFDLRSPYGYAGPLIQAEVDSFLPLAMQRWTDAMCDRSIVTGFFRLDPLETKQFPTLARHGELCERGETVSIDLTLEEFELWDQLRPSVRQNIRAARKKGLVGRTHRGNQDWETFQSVYYETMDRARAALNYYFPPEHFQGLAALLKNQLFICQVEDPQGDAQTAGLFIEHDGIVQYHLAGTRTAALRSKPTDLMVWSAILEAKARGNRTLHLGGGRGSTADSLFSFKAGFSKRRHRFATWHIVFMPDAYRQLSTRRQACAEVQIPETAFFPAYRS